MGKRVVINLTRELRGNNHHVNFDNFFTNYDLLQSLKGEKIFACGTVRKDRKDLPSKYKSDKEMKKGDYEYKTSYDGIARVKWMDNRAVYFLSNFHDRLDKTQVKTKERDGSLTSVTIEWLFLKSIRDS